MKVLIVDDEELARAVLREYLSGMAGVEIVGEAENGFAAVKLAHELAPDLLLLDIQMPKLSGFEVLELLGGAIPAVFVTAHDEHALRAFEVHAVDYVLKPVDRERLATALERARERLARGERGPQPAALAAAARPPGAPLERVLVREEGKVHVLPVGKIDYVEAQDDYLCFHVTEPATIAGSAHRTEPAAIAGSAHRTEPAGIAGSAHRDKQRLRKQQTLAELEAQLDPRRFVRIHRSLLLNVERLAGLEMYAKDSWVARLADGTRLPVSRAGHERLKALL